MRYEAKKIEATLELSADGEEKSFEPKERVSSEFAERIFDEVNIYQLAQESLPESERDRMAIVYLKGLSWIYKDFDINWVKKHFTNVELKEIFAWAMEMLVGAKKDEES